MKKLNALGQLLGCYFHQDWADEFDSDLSALQAIVESEPREQVSAGIKELDDLLAASLSEDELGAILMDDAGCYFEPRSLGMTKAQWLVRVREKFMQSVV